MLSRQQKLALILLVPVGLFWAYFIIGGIVILAKGIF